MTDSLWLMLNYVSPCSFATRKIPCNTLFQSKIYLKDTFLYGLEDFSSENKHKSFSKLINSCNTHSRLSIFEAS